MLEINLKQYQALLFSKKVFMLEADNEQAKESLEDGVGVAQYWDIARSELSIPQCAEDQKTAVHSCLGGVTHWVATLCKSFQCTKNSDYLTVRNRQSDERFQKFVEAHLANLTNDNGALARS